MKGIPLHLPSVIVGLGLAALLAVTVPPPWVTPVRVVGPATVYAPAHPKDFVRIVEGTPLTVPNDRLLVVTALGHVSGDSGLVTTLKVGGRTEGYASPSVSSEIHSSMLALPAPGVVARPGSTVEVVGAGARAWGYLADM